MGLSEFSLPAGQIAAVKSVLVRLDAQACRARVRRFLEDAESSGPALVEELRAFMR